MIEISKQKPAPMPLVDTDKDSGSSLLAMLVAGLIMIVIGYVGIMIFV